MTAREIAAGFTLLEGPRWRPDGLYVSDFFTESVLRFPAPQTSADYEVVCRVPGRPSGLGFDPEGRLLVVSMLERKLYRLDGDRLDVVADFSDLIAGPANDMYVDPTGRAYIGGFGVSADDPDLLEPTILVGVSPEGEVSVAATELIFPNGIVPVANDTALLVAETYRGRVARFAKDADGTLTYDGAFVDRPGEQNALRVSEGDTRAPWLPDGMVVDAEGGVWVADAKGRGATRFSADGRETGFVSSGELSVYACALGGDDGKTLFLCCAPAVGTFDPTAGSASALLAARVEVPGVAQ